MAHPRWREAARRHGLSPRAIRWLSALKQGKVAWYEARGGLTMRDWIMAGDFVGFDASVSFTPKPTTVHMGGTWPVEE